MNGETMNHTTLMDKAREEAAKRMGGRPVGIYDVDDIAQEMLIRYFMIAANEVVAKSGALLGDLAFKSFSNAVKREKRRRMQHPQFDQIADDCIVIQHWEREEIVDEQIEALHQFARNDIQRRIILHARLGLADDDAVDRMLMQRCMKTSSGNLATQKHRLKAAATSAKPLRTAIVTTPGQRRKCECSLFQRNILAFIRAMRVVDARDGSFSTGSRDERLDRCVSLYEGWSQFGGYIPIIRESNPLVTDFCCEVDSFLDGCVEIQMAFDAFMQEQGSGGDDRNRVARMDLI